MLVLEVLFLDAELVVDFWANEELLVVGGSVLLEECALVVLVVDLVTLTLVVELVELVVVCWELVVKLWTTDEVDEVLTLLPVLV